MSKHPSTRAHRRAHKSRVIRNRRKSISWLADYLASKDPNITDHKKQVALGAISKTATSCSCWMCGNPRRKFGYKTLAEMCADDSKKRELKEWFAH